MNRRAFLLLWILCVLGFFALLPYFYYLELIPLSLPLISIGAAQVTFLYGLICYLSYKILPKTDLKPFETNNIWIPGILSGLAIGLLIFALEKLIFHSVPLSKIHPPFWVGSLAAIYGAVNEEVLLRLFLFSTVYWLISKVIEINTINRVKVLWGVNFFIALVFGLGHLPALFKLVTPNAIEVGRVLILNGIAGLTFGWLYWSKGLWAAMIAHFSADLILHGILA